MKPAMLIFITNDFDMNFGPWRYNISLSIIEKETNLKGKP